MRGRGEPPGGQKWDRNHSNRNDLQRHQGGDKERNASEDTTVDQLDGKAYLDWLDARNNKFKEDMEKHRQEMETMDRKH